MTHLRRTASLPAAVFATVAVMALPARAQSVTKLAQSCTAAGGPEASCTETAVTAAAAQGFTGLLAGLGSEVPGSASTLGRRIGLTPRIAVGLRTAVAHVAMPDLVDPNGPPSRKTSFLIPMAEVDVTAGVFNGFRLLPTVGGFLSLDVLGNASFIFLPSGEGFAGRVTAYTLGARLGILRESFTLPGVSVSVSHRDIGTVRLNTSSAGAVPAVWLDPFATSVRATVGKDVKGVGVLAGVGWDWYGGHARIRLTDPSMNTFEGSVGQLRQYRTLYFAGASMNFLILQLSTELGWAEGFDPVVGYQGNPFDPTAGTFFGSVAFRLTM